MGLHHPWSLFESIKYVIPSTIINQHGLLDTLHWFISLLTKPKPLDLVSGGSIGSWQLSGPIKYILPSRNKSCRIIMYVRMYIIYIYIYIYIYMHIYLYIYIYMSNQPPLIHSSRTIAIITHRIGVAQKFPYRMQPYQPPTAAEEPHFS